MKQTVEQLKSTANVIRQDIVEMVHLAGSGHPGGSLSSADILATLYFNVMNVDPENTSNDERDRFVLSKGHAAPVLYSALARRGYFKPELLKQLRKTGAMLQGHPDMKGTPGVEMSTGSLGQGFSSSIGMAIGKKLDNSSARIHVLLGDGELNEGIVWEAAMAGAHYKLDNLVAVLDYNGLQIDGKNSEVMNVSPVDEKFLSFGWNVIVTDGHDVEALLAAFEEAKTVKGKPTLVIATTIKGKGVSFMEDQAGWHGTAPNVEQFEKAMKELGR
ncbi:MULTISPECIES: transketolase [unclassified Fusibacter]|uniref:transketolase n=1 Tax=unclassified Fusibacter TaxID=2624464 RepID=UPI0010130459|nr:MULTISPECIES: transketolase [unclassified Fusibacter]MCK8060552.1 transketolase [Fusibacter sp. A2]NPE22994.1 transketolase [Fusibacter sp. A1]RXV60059.1 transketolase [Fusibacter sp. A1]